MFGASHSPAAIFVIPDGDVAALISAINTANTNGEEDTIELAPNGNYTLLEPAELCFRTGLPYLGPDTGGTLTIHGNGARISRDSGNPNNFRIFEMSNGNFAFSDLIIGGGSAVEMDPCWGNPMGGAIFMYYANLTVTR
ncbi:MAG: hypothetical protein ABI925_07430, partial [Verrucomicrobiota bacterium]